MHVVLSQDMSLLSNKSARGGKVPGKDEVIVVRCGSVLTRIAQYWMGLVGRWEITFRDLKARQPIF